jgi:single-strand DNA-binding protein
VVVWRQENLANYLTKGKQVYVEGRIQTRRYDDKDGRKIYATEVVAEDIVLLGGGRGEDASDAGSPQQSRARRAAANGNGKRQAGTAANEADFDRMDISDDDVPW